MEEGENLKVLEKAICFLMEVIGRAHHHSPDPSRTASHVQGARGVHGAQEIVPTPDPHDLDIFPEISPLVLAYLGDAVYELCARTWAVAQRKDHSVEDLHKTVSRLVKADAQAKAFLRLEPYLTDEELWILHRGRNAKGRRHPKSAGVTAYRKSTGFEALIGYLYLTGRHERLMQLVDWSLEELTERD